MINANNLHVFLAVLMVALLISSSSICIGQTESLSSNEETFYVGVTYCGDSVAEAKQLVDKVKDYTNLFVLQSGELQNQPNAVNEIGDYAVDSGMGFIAYFGTDSAWLLKNWLDTYDGHWGESFLGVYFGDEPGGKMLDNEMAFYDQDTQSAIRKMADGSISVSKTDGNGSISYKRDRTIVVTALTEPRNPPANFTPSFTGFSIITYFPNGTRITVNFERPASPPTTVEDTVPLSVYEELWSARPFQSYEETAQRFTGELNEQITRARNYDRQLQYRFFTSDYALYWFDYLAGYDVLLAQFGWNHSIVQDIALARGAANLQGRDWGAIVTWKYTEEPYLAGGSEVFEQMRLAYECGARYIVIFNYAEDMQGTYGTLTDDHFQALERFWNEVVQNSTEVNGGTRGEAAMVLPGSYGWGMRNAEDKIWGLWDADVESEEIWSLRCALIEDCGANLDIVYDDPAYTAEGNYAQIFYTYEEELEPFPTTLVTVIAIVVAVASLGLVVYFKKRKRQAAANVKK